MENEAIEKKWISREWAGGQKIISYAHYAETIRGGVV